MPILGTFGGASARAYGLGAGTKILTAFDSISTTTLGTNASEVILSSIPQTYQHLQLRMMIKNHTANTNNTRMQVNSDAANLTAHNISGNGTTIGSSGNSSSSYWFMGNHPNNTLANAFAVYVVNFLDYANTNKNKTMRCLSGYDLNGSGNVYFISGTWLSNTAINSIRIFSGADTFIANSTFALYGIGDNG
jgi:hypothetical protein